jgi:hypothetical protein
MVQKKLGKHSDDSYFFSCNVQWYNSKNNKDVCFHNMLSAVRPVAHGPDITTLPETLDKSPDDSEYDVSNWWWCEFSAYNI